MKKGYDVFGRAYGVMLRNDLHAPNSVDHLLLREMVLLDDESREYLYSARPAIPDMRGHELYSFAQRFKAGSDRQTIENILAYCSGIASAYDVPFEDMSFGGTEKQILDRGTDWCADMARVGAALLGCCGIPARLVNLADLSRAYYGHVVNEAFFEGGYGVCDFLYGYLFYDEKPLDVYELLHNKQYLERYSEDYASLYSAAAISEYDPMGENDYTVSSPNQYNLTLINTEHGGRWIMGEDREAGPAFCESAG